MTTMIAADFSVLQRAITTQFDRMKAVLESSSADELRTMLATL